MSISDEDLSKLLVEGQFITEENLKIAKDLSLSKKISFYKALIEKSIFNHNQLGQIISDHLGYRFVSLSQESIDKNTLSIIPEKLAKKYRAITFFVDEKVLKIATSDPNNKDFFDLLKKKSNREIEIFYATDFDVEEALNLYKKQIQSKFDELIKKPIDKSGKIVETDAPVEDIVSSIIENAYDNKASDIHIEPRKDHAIVRLRIDGILHDVLELPKDLQDKVINKIKVDSHLRTDEHLGAQDGKMQKKLEKEEIDIRVSIVPIVNGEACVLRLLTSNHRTLGLKDLGMNEKDLANVEEAFTKPYGMILSTGPTGSGKTTTIYSILKILNTKQRNIDTIEDPVEYEIEGVNQIQVNNQTNLTFAAGLRSILRQDPDIIYVGEIRDEETAGIAINSAMTGHLVLSTLHTNNASTSLPRLIDMKIEPFLVSSTINVIIGQRLIRKICEKCKVSYTNNFSFLTDYFNKDIIKKIFGTKKIIRLYKGKGCEICHHTGYLGRIGIFEVLKITPAIQDLINKKSDAALINKKAVEEGMTSMLVDGMTKVGMGLTTFEEILRVTKE